MSGFGPAELVAGLCHTEEENPFPVWQDGHISPCFNQLILGALPHAGMAVCSACYLSMARWVICGSCIETTTIEGFECAFQSKVSNKVKCGTCTKRPPALLLVINKNNKISG